MTVPFACTPTPGDETETSETSATGDTTGPDPTDTSTGATDDSGDTSTGDASTGDASTGDASTGDASTSDATTGDATTGEPACLKFVPPVSDPENPTLEFTCGLPELCPGDKPLEFTLSDHPEFGDPVATTEDVARARCMVAALRDRTPGHFEFASFYGFGSWDLRDEVIGESGARRHVRLEDFSFEHIEKVNLLREPAFFAACHAEGTADALWKCLWDAYTETCVESPLACPP